MVLNRRQLLSYIELLKQKILEQDKRIKMVETRQISVEQFSKFQAPPIFMQQVPTQYVPTPSQTTQNRPPHPQKRKPKPSSAKIPQPPVAPPQKQEQVPMKTEVTDDDEYVETDKELDELLKDELEELKNSDIENSSAEPEVETEVEEIVYNKPVYKEHPNFSPMT